jgi:hypothetical protein
VFGLGQRAREGADKTHVLVELGLQNVGRLLCLEAIGLQVLFVLPAEREAVDAHHGATGDQQRQRHQRRAPPPQPARRPADDPAQRRRQQYAERVAGPPGEPEAQLRHFGEGAQRIQDGNGNRGAGEADERGQQQKSDDIMAGVDRRAHVAAELARAEPGLQQGADGADQCRRQRCRGGQRRIGGMQGPGGQAGAERDRRQHAHAAGGGHGQADAGGWKQRQRISGRQGQPVVEQPHGEVSRDDRQAGDEDLRPAPTGVVGRLAIHVSLYLHA